VIKLSKFGDQFVERVICIFFLDKIFAKSKFSVSIPPIFLKVFELMLNFEGQLINTFILVSKYKIII